MLDLQGIRNTESKENDTKTFRSSILSSRPELKELEGLDERIKLLEAQTDKLFTNVHRLNKHFWKGLLDHKSLMDQPLGLYSMGDSSEMVMLVQYFAWTWVETDGAIDWVKKRLPRIERNGYSI